MLKYIELKTGHADSGPAWVARVRASKSGKIIYFNGKALKRTHLLSANHYDMVSREEYWVSGIKKDGLDRHQAGSWKVAIEAGAVGEFLRVTGSAELDLTRFEVIENLEPPDLSKLLGPESAADGRPRRRRDADHSGAA